MMLRILTLLLTFVAVATPEKATLAKVENAAAARNTKIVTQALCSDPGLEACKDEATLRSKFVDQATFDAVAALLEKMRSEVKKTKVALSKAQKVSERPGSPVKGHRGGAVVPAKVKSQIKKMAAACAEKLDQKNSFCSQYNIRVTESMSAAEKKKAINQGVRRAMKDAEKVAKNRSERKKIGKATKGRQDPRLG